MGLLYLLLFIASTVALGKEIYIYIYGGKCDAKASPPPILSQAPKWCGVDSRGGTALRCVLQKSVEKIQDSLNSDKNNAYFT